jgi:hypothetical protein
MKISAIAGMFICAAFALLCFGFAFNGFSALAALTDATERELSSGYAWFWTFLGGVAVVFGILSWMIKEGKFGDPGRM